MFSTLFSFARVGALAVIAILALTIWWQDGVIESKSKKIDEMEANITAIRAECEADSFEAKWSNEFDLALQKELKISTQNESKGKDNEKSSSVNSSRVFYDTF